MIVETHDGQVECPQCGVANEQGLFVVELPSRYTVAAVQLCADCLMLACGTSRLDSIKVVGVTVVRLETPSDHDVAMGG